MIQINYLMALDEIWYEITALESTLKQYSSTRWEASLMWEQTGNIGGVLQGDGCGVET
jgi:hypothetical protein